MTNTNNLIKGTDLENASLEALIVASANNAEKVGLLTMFCTSLESYILLVLYEKGGGDAQQVLLLQKLMKILVALMPLEAF